jgi:hypothetical protein
MEEIESGSVLNMTDSSSPELLEELNSKCRKWRTWPAATITSLSVIVVAAIYSLPIWLIILISMVALCLIVFTYYWGQLKKSVALFYDLDSALEKDYQYLHDAFDKLNSCYKIWHIESQGHVIEQKYHAGASTLIDRKPRSLTKEKPPFVKTNILVPIIHVGRQRLYFFPDRLLVFDIDSVGAVGYDSLKISVSETRFIEDGSIPGDSQIVDKT